MEGYYVNDAGLIQHVCYFRDSQNKRNILN